MRDTVDTLAKDLAGVCHTRTIDATADILRALPPPPPRRTNADKRKSILALLANPDWIKWSDATLARAAEVDSRLVKSVRESVGIPSPTPSKPKPKLVMRGGAYHYMLMGGQGRKRV